MPTYKLSPEFRREYMRLAPAQRDALRRAVTALVADLRTGRFRPGLRVHKLRDSSQWSMTWAPDGRATFEYRPEQRPGHPHVIWRRVGGHEIHR